MGRGGQLTVTATEAVTIAGRDSEGSPSGLFSDTFGRGRGGNIDLRAPHVRLSDGGVVAARSLGDGPGGATIESSLGSTGRGGDMTVVATEAIVITGPTSGLLSNTFGSGDAGRLFVATPLLTLDGGIIAAGTDFGSRGNAGAIEVQGGRVTLTGGATISHRGGYDQHWHTRQWTRGAGNRHGHRHDCPQRE